MIRPILNSIGLIFDILGACLVAWEVVSQYKGNKFISPSSLGKLTDTSDLPAAELDPAYKTYEAEKYRKMKCGLFSLIIGFIFQIVSNWF